ncbi:hypothetical protein JEQ12_011747 [Ovis aries]|uniref:Uncharacterized protein n=1 Tax=Ovis aries TaxID=9940 RepID=A0A835ZQD0_SHEEP|nr:hypothetical protein JEQ12_011747 [Ovis aries]
MKAPAPRPESSPCLLPTGERLPCTQFKNTTAQMNKTHRLKAGPSTGSPNQPSYQSTQASSNITPMDIRCKMRLLPAAQGSPGHISQNSSGEDRKKPAPAAAPCE